MRNSERWKDITGYERYEVSTWGDVRNKKTGRILKAGMGGKNSSTAQVALSRDNKIKSFCVHRLVAEAFLPDFDRDLMVIFKNGDRLDANVSNLEMGPEKALKEKDA